MKSNVNKCNIELNINKYKVTIISVQPNDPKDWNAETLVIFFYLDNFKKYFNQVVYTFNWHEYEIKSSRTEKKDFFQYNIEGSTFSKNKKMKTVGLFGIIRTTEFITEKEITNFFTELYRQIMIIHNMYVKTDINLNQLDSLKMEI